jgi:peptidoglycan/xylan/chitin deacetylase (PgdA/CDA1 family)
VLAAPLAAPLAHASSAKPAHATIALTFDDLPGLSLRDDQPYVDASNRALVAALRHNRIPAIGFVNMGKVADLVPAHQMANLRLWLDAGFDLGNHTFGHEPPDTLGAQHYIDDIARNDPPVRRLMADKGRPLVWFRHPYLETGATAETRTKIDGWLARHGYRVAPVTVDANDWEFAEVYDDALARGDKAEAARIRRDYLAYTERSLDWSRRAAHLLFGREIAQVMLLHDTRLNADSMDALARLLHRLHLRPVSLDRAMRDRAYRTPDRTLSKDGVDWLERWSETLKKPLPWDDFTDVPADIAAAYHRVDPDEG